MVREKSGVSLRRAGRKFEPQMERPNILWIVTTQWRAQSCGHAGDPNARTPRLDALAAESVNYTLAVTPHPMGPMARAALLTGVPSPENGVRGYFDPLPAGARTIAHALRDRGYATAFFGKWGVGRRDPALPLVGEAAAQVIVPEGERGGFEFWEGFEGGFQLNDPWLHGNRLAKPEKFTGYQSDVVCERMAGWLREREEDERRREKGGNAERGARSAEGGIQNPRSKTQNFRPWFCVVSLEAPHPPYDAGTGGVLKRAPEEIALAANVPRGGETEAKARRELAGYYAHIAATDWAIGGLLDDLRAHAPRRVGNTIVVFTSVHGDMHGAHGLFRKGWPHEESIRVPLLIRGGGMGGASRDDRPVSLLDLPAMTLAWADGKKWEPRGEAARISMPSVVNLPHQCDRVWRGVRTRTRKLVLNSTHSTGSGQDGSPWLFFDLENDPLELSNLAGDPARAAEIAALARLA
jgi:arylsulfatase A-like enzyme